MINAYIYILTGIIVYCVFLTLWILYLHNTLADIVQTFNEHMDRSRDHA